MLSQEEFSKEFNAVLATLEERRKRYLVFFYLGCAGALLLLAAVFFYSHTILNALLALGHHFNSTDHADITAQSIQPSDVFLLIFDAMIGCGFLILTPIFHYRGTNRSAALQTFRFHRFSLKDAAYSRLFRLLAPLEFAPRGGVSLVETRGSTLFPDDTLYLSEDVVVGTLNEVTVKFCEAEFANIANQRRVSFFKGLLIVLDISALKVKLRSNFHGRTTIIYDPQKTLPSVQRRYQSMQHFPLPDAFEPILEGYTTDVEEAQRIVTNEFLQSIEGFAGQLSQLQQQVQHWDDKLAYAVAETYDYCKDKILSFPSRKSQLPGEVPTSKSHQAGLDLTKADPIDTDITSLNAHFALEYYDDKLIITIPCVADLFETNSLFEPALNHEDAAFLYHLMMMLDTITQHINKVKI